MNSRLERVRRHMAGWLVPGRPPLVTLSILVGAIFLVLFTLDAVTAFRFGPDLRQTGWDGVNSGGTWTVRSVPPGGPASGRLLPGDVIVAFNGDSSILAAPPRMILDTVPAGPYTLAVRRGNEQRDVVLPLVVTRTPAMYVQISLNLLLSLAFFATGMLIALAKPNDSIGWRAWASALTTAAYVAYVATTPGGISDVRGAAAWIPSLFAAVFPLHFLASYRFLSVFPVSFPASRTRRWAEAALIGAGFAIWAIGGLWIVARRLPLDSLRNLSRAVPGVFRILDTINLAQLLYMSFVIVATVAICIANYRKLTDQDQRRRIRWVFAGIVVSAVPMIVMALSWVIWAAMGIADQMQPELAVMSGISNLMLAAVPVSMAYAVLKHRVLGIQVVVRRGVQYLLAANGLRVLVALPVIVLVAGFVAHPDRTVTQLLFEGSAKWNSVLLVAAAAGLRYRSRLRDAIDRRFFRESYNQERILAGLISTLTRADSIRPMCSAVAAELEVALHPEHAHVFIYERHEMSLAHASAEHAALPTLPGRCEAFDLLAVSGKAVAWSDFERQCGEDSSAPLKALRAELLVPILSSERKLVGLIALGAKKSEEPYTARDRELLELLAAQLGVAQENLSLRSIVNVQRTTERDVLARLSREQIDVVKECPACGRCFDSGTSVCESDGVELVLSVPVERTIDGRYRLDRVLGKGGMGAVYAAQDLRLNRAVAVKVMKGGLFGDPGAIRRFSREAQAAARLNHPNIVRIFDFGSLTGDGAYQVLELVPGSSWRSALARAGQWTPGYATPLFRGVLDGLACAHEAGIVHRDLKPENVLLEPGGSADAPAFEARILDFGLAKIRAEGLTESFGATRPGTVVGTFAYMSPEQLSGSDVDQRTDIYAIGVILLETLTGPLPFRSLNVREQIQQFLKSRFQFDGMTPAHLAVRDVIAKAMAPDRINRYRRVVDLATDLTAALARCPPFPDRRGQLPFAERYEPTATLFRPEDGRNPS